MYYIYTYNLGNYLSLILYDTMSIQERIEIKQKILDNINLVNSHLLALEQSHFKLIFSNVFESVDGFYMFGFEMLGDADDGSDTQIHATDYYTSEELLGVLKFIGIHLS